VGIPAFRSLICMRTVRSALKPARSVRSNTLFSATIYSPPCTYTLHRQKRMFNCASREIGEPSFQNIGSSWAKKTASNSIGGKCLRSTKPLFSTAFDNFVFRSVASIISFSPKKHDRVSVPCGGRLTVVKRMCLPAICSDHMAHRRARAAEILSENKAGNE
jgi:hypothetical protein